jgi:hypothetical protein
MKDFFKKLLNWIKKVVSHKLFLPILFTLLTMVFMPISILIGGAMFGVAVNYFIVYIIDIYKK